MPHTTLHATLHICVPSCPWPGKAEEPLKAFHAKPCDEYIVYVTRSRPLAERHCVVISGKACLPRCAPLLRIWLPLPMEDAKHGTEDPRASNCGPGRFEKQGVPHARVGASSGGRSTSLHSFQAEWLE